MFCHAHQYDGVATFIVFQECHCQWQCVGPPTAWPELCFTGTSCISHAHGLVEDAVVITTGESMWAESTSLTIPVM